MKHVLLALVCLPFLASCATVHSEYAGMAAENKLPLKLSATTVGDTAQEDSFQLVEITMENTSDKWVKVTSGKVLIGEAAANDISVMVGNDLRDWAKAVSNREKIKSQNDGVLMASLLTAGAVASVASGDRTVQAAGNLSQAVGYGMIADRLYSGMMRDAMGVAQTPEDYVTAPVNIPGKLFQRRWLVLNKPAGQLVRTLVVEFETTTGEKDIYVVGL